MNLDRGIEMLQERTGAVVCGESVQAAETLLEKLHECRSLINMAIRESRLVLSQVEDDCDPSGMLPALRMLLSGASQELAGAVGQVGRLR